MATFPEKLSIHLLFCRNFTVGICAEVVLHLKAGKTAQPCRYSELPAQAGGEAWAQIDHSPDQKVMLTFFTSSIDVKLKVTGLVAGLLPALIQTFSFPVWVRYVLLWGAIIGAGQVNAKSYFLIFNENYCNDSSADANGRSCATPWVTNASTNAFGAWNTMQGASEVPTCLITGSNSVCGSSQATFTAPSGMSTYLWSISGNASISGSATGASVTVNVSSFGSFTLSLAITDVSNGSANCSKMVSIIAAPSCSVSGPSLVCNNTPGNIYSAPSGMSSYFWVVSGPATLVGSNTGSSISVTSGFAGAFQVQVTVTDANGCSSTCSTLGGNLPGPSCFISGPATSCANSTSNTFQSIANFGVTSYNWSISGNATIVGSTMGSSISVSAGSSGSYTVSLTLVNNNNCTTTCSQTVNITALPTCMIGGPTNVCGNSVGNVFTAPAGMSNYSWSLTGDATITGSTASSSITVDAGPSGSFMLGLNITDPNGCSSTCTLPMTITEKPTVTAGINTQTICSNSSISTIVATPSDGASISWTRDQEAAVTGMPASGTGNISGTLVNTTNAPILVTFTITASVNGCLSEPVVSTVLVNAVPACPSLFSPSNGQLGVQANVGLLDWNDVPYANSYLVYLGTNAPDYNNVINGTSVSASTIPIGTLANSTNYGFRIVPVNDCGQATSCTAVTFSTCTPTFACPANRDVNLNANCALVVPDLVTGLAANPGCGSLTFTQSPTAGTVAPSSHNGTVLVVITPDNPAVAPCTVTLTGKDVTPPSITCPGTQLLALGADCSASLPNYTNLASPSDNCSIQSVTQSPTAGTPVSGAGNMSVTLTVTDFNGNETECTFTVSRVDQTPPTINCFNQTVGFDGQGSLVLDPEELAEAADNCGTPTLSLSSPTISCAQLGQPIAVTVTATDAAGLTATCTSQVTVTGLPCGWSQTPDGIGCSDGNDIDFNPTSQVWTATSTHCYYAPPFTADEAAFAQRTLCGNGSIQAQVTSLNGAGWAGIVLREGNAPGARKVQLMTNLSSFSRREVRFSTGGTAFPQQFPSQNRYWLRLLRVGNQFVGYVSANGQQWSQVFALTVNMANCIEAGLVVTNATPTGTVTATFTNVHVQGSSSLDTGDLSLGLGDNPSPELAVFPNPTSGEVFLDLSSYAGQALTVDVLDLTGRVLQTTQLDSAPALESLDLSAYQAGLYLVRVRAEGQPDQVRRVVRQ